MAAEQLAVTGGELRKCLGSGNALESVYDRRVCQ